MTDHRALIESARAEHKVFKHQPSGLEFCQRCQVRAPCFPARLADALAQQSAALSAEVEAQCDYVSKTTRAALRLVAERDDALARLAQAERERDEALTERADGGCPEVAGLSDGDE